jgi:hypothetical protein
MMGYRTPYPIEILSRSHVATFNNYIANLKQQSLSSDYLFQLFNSVDKVNNNCLHVAATTGNIDLIHVYIARVIEFLGKEKGTYLIVHQISSRNHFGYLPHYDTPNGHPMNVLLADLYNDPIRIIAISCNVTLVYPPHKNPEKETKSSPHHYSQKEIKPSPWVNSLDEKNKPPSIYDRAMDSSYLGFRLPNSIFFFSNPLVRRERAESPHEAFNINEIVSSKTP